MSVVAGLLRALATMLRRPDDKHWQGREREDMWGDNQPLSGGNYAEDARERAKLEALLDAEGQPGKLDAEWLAAQAQIRQTRSG